MAAADPSIPSWLQSLPLAPEFRPTETEFADPIAFISRVEREAAEFGICKIIPPLPKPSKRFVVSNLNRSLASSSPDANPAARFTTRQQELGSRRARQAPVHKQVWQSGELYTLDQFEAKSKSFSRTHLSNFKETNPLLVESLFWKATGEKPIYIEYANDVPGSGFGVPDESFRRYSSSQCRKRKRSFDGPNCPTSGESEMEGSAGWRLSNSHWNLQVISRAPGSLTRFMPDDVPGVTSPMVYIGMLFSWFAWHVEDHELHSMNFLHMGAPKTWYAVPGEYASTVEEIVRVQGYGGNMDRLEAFTMLGEKTTLLSPDIFMASAVPCCRLVQHPGEFVVTFPRAYHVGFSHGFNCGEAANFATSQWLKVAKDAAVRRAAMNCLPMLSHQQLLYMLTMSFISRLPRALLPGVRSSRLKNRKKEDREILVKKAFLNDIMYENRLLCALLAKESTFCAVLWEPELLPSSVTGSQSFSLSSSVEARGSTVDDGHGRETLCSNLQDRTSFDCRTENISVENVLHGVTSDLSSMPCNNRSSIVTQKSDCHIDDTILNWGKLEDVDVNEDELPCGLNVDSGSLQCVSCGILGYPFMAILQPSEKASKELFSINSEEFRGGAHVKDNAIAENGSSTINLSGIKSIVEIDRLPSTSIKKSGKMISNKWNTSNRFLRPRIFCLKHALDIDNLLQCKGGANVLILCHSDYVKIKAHTMSIAEESGTKFNCNDAPLEKASPQDLDLLNISVDDEEHSDDWTSKLGVNLGSYLKLRKQPSPDPQLLTLALAELFSDSFPLSVVSRLKWCCRKSRTPYKVIGVVQSKPTIDANKEKIEPVMRNSNADSMNRIQVYHSRRSGHNHMAKKNHDLPIKSAAKDLCSSKENGTLEEKDFHRSESDDANFLNNELEKKNTDHLHTIPILFAENPRMHQESRAVEKINITHIIDFAKPEVLTAPADSSVEVCEGLIAVQPNNEDTLTVYEHAKSDSLKISEFQSDTVAREVGSSSEFNQGKRIAGKHNLAYEEDRNVDSAYESFPRGSVDYSEDLHEVTVGWAPNLKPKVLDDQALVPVSSSSFEMQLEDSTAVEPTVNNFITLEEVSVARENNMQLQILENPTPVNSGGVSKNHGGSTVVVFKSYVRRNKRKREAEQMEKIVDDSFGGFIRGPCEGLRPRIRKTTCRSVLDQKITRKRVKNNGGDERPLKCLWKGCGKSFKWAWALTEHVRLHTGERPYECRVDGCGLTFRFISEFSRHRRKTGHSVGS